MDPEVEGGNEVTQDINSIRHKPALSRNASHLVQAKTASNRGSFAEVNIEETQLDGLRSKKLANQTQSVDNNVKGGNRRSVNATTGKQSIRSHRGLSDSSAISSGTTVQTYIPQFLGKLLNFDSSDRRSSALSFDQREDEEDLLVEDANLTFEDDHHLDEDECLIREDPRIEGNELLHDENTFSAKHERSSQSLIKRGPMDLRSRSESVSTAGSGNDSETLASSALAGASSTLRVESRELDSSSSDGDSPNPADDVLDSSGPAYSSHPPVSGDEQTSESEGSESEGSDSEDEVSLPTKRSVTIMLPDDFSGSDSDSSVDEAYSESPSLFGPDLEEADRPANDADSRELAEEDLLEMHQLSGNFMSPYELAELMFAKDDEAEDLDRLFSELMSGSNGSLSSESSGTRSARSSSRRAARTLTRGLSVSSSASATPSRHRRNRSLRPKLSHAQSLGHKMFKSLLTSKRSFRESFSNLTRMFPTRTESEVSLESVMDMYPNRSSVIEYTLEEGDEGDAYSYEVEYGTCPICIEEVDTRNIITVANCKHKFCTECFHTHLKFEIFAGRSAEMRCPYPGCKVQLKRSFLKKVLSEAEYKQLDSWETQYKVEHNPTLFACTTPACETIFTWDGDRPLGVPTTQELRKFYSRNSPMHAHCDTCQVDFCLYCKEAPFHVGVPCRPGKAGMQNRGGSMDELTRDFLNQNVAICRNCGTGIDRRNSSTHMQCLCGYQFCLICGAENAECDCQSRIYLRRNLARLRERQRLLKESGKFGCFNFFAIWQTKMIYKCFGYDIDAEEEEVDLLHEQPAGEANRHSAPSARVQHARMSAVLLESNRSSNRRSTSHRRSHRSHNRRGTGHSSASTTRSRRGTGQSNASRKKSVAKNKGTKTNSNPEQSGRGEPSFVVMTLPGDQPNADKTVTVRVATDEEHLHNVAKRRHLYKNRTKMKPDQPIASKLNATNNDLLLTVPHDELPVKQTDGEQHLGIPAH